MRSVLACLLLISIASTALPQEIDAPIRGILFKVSSSLRYPDFYEPWKKAGAVEVTGTGFLIEGNRILTNAHLVRYNSQVYVQAEGSDQQTAAAVEFISPDVDLAILKLENESILKARKPIPFDAEIPKPQDELVMYGYPLSGNQLSVTKLTASRMEYMATSSYASGQRMKIDATINKGNSGGPVLFNGKIVGIVSSGVQESDNTSFIIPADEIEMFRQDVSDGNADGKSYLWVEVGTVESPALRQRLQIPEGTGGVHISRVNNSDADYPMRVDDVITKIGTHPLDSHGEVVVTEGISLDWHYFVPKLDVQRKVPLTIWRQGKSIDIAAPLMKTPPLLIRPLPDAYPSYAIIGPLAFEPLSLEMCMGFATSQDWSMALRAASSPIMSDLWQPPKTPDQELVTVACSFTSPLMNGYTTLRYKTLAKVNGTEIRNLKHLVEFLRDCKDEFLQFSFYDRYTEDLTFNRKDFMASTEDVLSDNSIRKQFSADLADLWKD